jgi:diguanylate cyclase (GGDEF)-like protein/PAS domain S-box-containing protein
MVFDTHHQYWEIKSSWSVVLRKLTLILAGMIIAGHTHAAEIIDMQLRWHHQFQFAGYYAALEKGFYKDEGLDVRIHAGDPAHQAVPEVLAGHAQYAEGNSEVLYQRLQGKPLVALAAIFQHSPSVLLTRQDSGIKSAHDLMGKKIMLMNMTEDADFLSMFLSEGISLSQVQIMPSSYDINDLISGKVDAFNSYTTNEPYFLKQKNIAYNIIDPSSYRIDFYSDILFTSEAELRNHPKRVEAMRRATLKGWRYAMDHPDEIITLLLDKYHVEKTRAHLEFEAADMRKLIFPDLIEIGHMNPGRWQHMADTFVNAGLIKPGYQLDGFIYDPSPKHALEWVLPLLNVALILLTIVSAVTYYLQRLNRRLTKTQSILSESEERLRLALGAANQGWFDLNIQTGVVSVSPEYAQMLGYEPSEFTSDLHIWETGIHPEDRPLVMTTYHQCLADGEPLVVEYRRQKKSGEWAWIRSIGKFTAWTPDRQPLRMSGIHTDITAQKVIEFELVRQAHTDHLTGFNNRGHFMQQAELELRRVARYGGALSIFMIDVDHFKKINDTYGHKVGDLVLQKLAAICRDTLRIVDIIGRVGGEEFAVLLPETAEQEAIRVAERLREAIADAKIPLGSGLPLSITVSVGITSLISKDDNIDVLLSVADKALYEAKNAGRNRICNIQARVGSSA